MPSVEVPDESYTVLERYASRTEELLLGALRQFDSEARCTIRQSLDLGLPHNVVRLAGGFPTGLVVQWSCSTPFVPVDTTVNACTVSVFRLADSAFRGISTLGGLEARMQHLESLKTPYQLNFRRGNHFISVCQESKSGAGFLVLHSSAAEFKNGASGLYPSPDAWYAPRIQTYASEGRYLRYITDGDARLFFRIAEQLTASNELRHEFLATQFAGLPEVLDLVVHSHHYSMPSPDTVAIGTCLVPPGTLIPLLSAPGQPIALCRSRKNRANAVQVGGRALQAVPHGWGKTSKAPLELTMSEEFDSLAINGVLYPVESESNLVGHTDLALREYPAQADDPASFLNRYQDELGVSIELELAQVVSVGSGGMQEW